jgi:DNA-binding transcriptional LysR family regulator
MSSLRYLRCAPGDHPCCAKCFLPIASGSSSIGVAMVVFQRARKPNIICRIPMFIGAAVVAKHADAVATLPLSIAAVLANDLDLQVITPPIKLPKIDIYQYWHERFHRVPGNQWIRSIFKSLFSKSSATMDAR